MRLLFICSLFIMYLFTCLLFVYCFFLCLFITYLFVYGSFHKAAICSHYSAKWYVNKLTTNREGYGRNRSSPNLSCHTGTRLKGLRSSGVPRGVFGGGSNPPPPKFRRPSKILPNSTRLWKLLKIAEFRAPAPHDVRKKGSKILKLSRFSIVLH